MDALLVWWREGSGAAAAGEDEEGHAPELELVDGIVLQYDRPKSPVQPNAWL